MAKRYSDTLLILGILLLAFFLLIFRLTELSPFIGDQGWFYLSARDMILYGKIPLVGITTSHTWLHHGALFTYMLAIALWIFSFHPLAGTFVSISFTLGAILLLYKLGSAMFGRPVGFIASFLFATSPLVMIHTRMAYHTSPLAFCSILFIFSFYKWLRGHQKFLPLTTFSLALLYNFEVSTFVFFVIFALVLVYGFIGKRVYVSRIDRKVVIISSLSFLLPMLPMLFFDLSHGFPQTLKFPAWVLFKILKTVVAFGSGSTISPFTEMIGFFAANFQRLVFITNGFIALAIFLAVFSWFLVKLSGLYREGKLNVAWTLLALWIVIPLGGELINHTPTEAHLIVLYPPVILLTSVFFVSFMKRVFSRAIIASFIIIIAISNVSFMINNEYLMGKKGGYGPRFSERLKTARSIVDTAAGKRYNLRGEGPGSQFESFTMNYEYLTWWLGNGPSKKKESLVFVIKETEDQIILERQHD